MNWLPPNKNTWALSEIDTQPVVLQIGHIIPQSSKNLEVIAIPLQIQERVDYQSEYRRQQMAKWCQSRFVEAVMSRSYLIFTTVQQPSAGCLSNAIARELDFLMGK